MGGFLTAKDLAWAVEHCPPQLIAVVILLVMAVMITWKVNRLIGEYNCERKKEQEEKEEIKKRIKINEKKTIKLTNCFCMAPCFKHNPTNVIWLQRDDKDGDSPPQKIKCPLIEEQKGG